MIKITPEYIGFALGFTFVIFTMFIVLLSDKRTQELKNLIYKIIKEVRK